MNCKICGFPLDLCICPSVIEQQRIIADLKRHAKSESQLIREKAKVWNAHDYKEAERLGQILYLPLDYVIKYFLQSEPKENINKEEKQQ